MSIPDVSSNMAANAMVAGSVLSFLGVVFTVWWSSNANERRDASVDRREADKEAKHDLEMCIITCDRLREERAVLLADNAFLRGRLAPPSDRDHI